MKYVFLFFCFLSSFCLSDNYTLLTVQDSINPGTADYIIRGIEVAEQQQSQFVVIVLDTPGGLLTSTRSIVQKILGTRLPVVVFVAPKGAQAGSAGAIITLASDVAAMAPGTNIGAAHPVSGGGEKIDETMKAKIENDTAAFAESLAKSKGRNTEWARKAVTKSSSIIAETALKDGVIDLIAENPSDLLKKLSRFKLKVPKGTLQELPATEGLQENSFLMNIKQRVVSFFANPNIAYLIMSLGGLCIWVEISHPGLIFPGILGALCIAVSLVSFQMLPIRYGALGMTLGGMVLLIIELFVPSFGAFGIGGILFFVLGSLYLMDTGSPEFQISQSIIFSTAAALTSFALFLGWMIAKSRHAKVTSGIEGMLGSFGEVKETISDRAGKVFVHGELWNAVSASEGTIPVGTVVVIEKEENMVLRVKPADQHLKGRV